MNIVGLDIGNFTSIAWCEDRHSIIESRVREFTVYDEVKGSSINVMKVGKDKIVIGEGDIETNPVKHDKENFLDLMFYSIAKVLPKYKGTCEVGLVASIPAGQFNRREELKSFIIANANRMFELNGVKHNILIQEVRIVPEGYPLKTLGHFSQFEDKLPILIIDIGGETTDLAEFNEEENFVNGSYVRLGLMKVYSKVVDLFDSWGYEIDRFKARKYFDGIIPYKENDYKEEYAKEFCKEIISGVKAKYKNMGLYNIVLAGGGANVIHKEFKKSYPNALVVTDTLANAKGNYIIGELTWQKK